MGLATGTQRSRFCNRLDSLGSNTHYPYDLAGKRASVTESGPATSNSATNYADDADETTVNGQAASYDFENHLVSLGSNASYVYDADGNRVSVASGSA